MTICRKATMISMLLFVTVVAGCGSFTEALKKGETLPAGKILVVGKIVLAPSVDQYGKKKVDKEPQDIMIGLTRDLSKKINEGQMYTAEVAIAPVLNETFFFALPPQYIRSGQVLKVIGHNISGPGGGRPFYEVLRVYKNIKLDISAKTQAVYIGTIVYHHDGKRATSVSVRDEYESAVRDLGKMQIGGVKNSMVKKLAVLVK